MSHFTVLVIGDNPDKQLAPYHEFECTGIEAFIEDIDTTEETKADYDTHTSSMIQVPAGASVPEDTAGYTVHPELGVLVSRFDDYFQVPNPDKTEDARWAPSTVFQLPAGFTEREVPTKELMTFSEFVLNYIELSAVEADASPDLEGDHQYGYAQLDDNGEVVKVVRRTNPNAKWDWYVLGGRWTGFFTLKPGAQGETGRPGVFGNTAGAGKADQALKGAIDFAAMRAEARAAAETAYDAFIQALEGVERPASWPEIRDAHPGEIDKALEAAKINSFRCVVDAFGWDREAYIQEQEDGAIGTYAVVMDGKWMARGQMGWFGMSRDELSDKEWQKRYTELLDSLPDDTLLSVFDCHI
jgi:hypothetical protein